MGNPTITLTPDVANLITADSPVAIGVSGGKDSAAVAFATIEHLNRVGHAGPRLLIHADLGTVEWADSLPTCQRLAERLGLELIVVRRPQGDLMDRWEQRWHDNVRRWVELSCVKLILPWSTPAMRFCTAELKVDQICRHLSRRWPGRAILSVTGIRREESAQRRNAPDAAPQPKLNSTLRGTRGLTWNAIAHWTLDDVLKLLEARGMPLHEAYTRYGADRVSCVYCMLASEHNHQAAARDPRSHSVGRRMVDLEIRSTFAFQSGRWLGDTLGGILTADQRAGVAAAKINAQQREQAEARLPKHLLYTKGWPTCCPTTAEARLLAQVRFAVAEAVGLPQTYIDPDEIIDRYQHLMTKR